jgi:hypothetical protein
MTPVQTQFGGKTMKKVLKAIAAFVATAAVAATLTATLAVSTSANTPVDAIGTICYNRGANGRIFYTIVQATEDNAWAWTHATALAGNVISTHTVDDESPADLRALADRVGKLDADTAAPFLNESEGGTSNRVIAFADPQGVVAGAFVGFQNINAGQRPTPADFTRDPSMGPITWVMCSESCCGVTPTTADQPTQGQPTEGQPTEATTGDGTVAPPASTDDENEETGIALVIVPTLVAAGAAIVTIKRRRK